MEQARWVFETALSLGACVFLLSATVRIFLVVRRIAKQNAVVVAQLNFNHKLHHGVAFKARETASAKMIGIVVTVFLVFYSLGTVYSVFPIAGSPHPQNMVEILIILVLLNSAVNPVAYAFHKREIKRELKRLFRSVVTDGRFFRGENRKTYEAPFSGK